MADQLMMRSLVSKAVSLSAVVLAFSMIGELALHLILHGPLPWLFYALMSGGLLGFVPSAPTLVLQRGATTRFRLALALALLALVLINSVLLAILNNSDFGWSVGNYTLALPTAFYVITCVAGFYSIRRGRISAS